MFSTTSSLEGPPGPQRELVVFRRSLLAVMVGTVLVLGTVFGSVPAFGYWGAAGTASTTAAVGTLAPPTNVSASAVASTVSVSWTAPAGLAPTGYYVTRTTDGTPMPACGSGPAALVTASSCSDTGVAAGSHTYVVTAVFRSWTAVSAAVTVVVDASNKVAFTSGPAANVTAGAPMTGLGVQLQTNALGLATAGVPVTISIGANPNGGTLSGTQTVNTDGTGTATFNDLNIRTAGAGYTLVASSPGYEGTVSATFTVTAASASQLVVTSSSSVSGIASATANIGPITVERRDAFGNPASIGQPALTLQPTAIGTGYFAAAAGGSGPISLSIPAGSASVSFYYGNRTAGSTALQFGAQGVTVSQAISVVVSAAPASKLQLTLPDPVPRSTAFNATVLILDEFGNQTASTANVILTSTGGSTCPIDIPTPAHDAVGGSALFTGLRINGNRTGCILTATSTGFQISSSPFSV